MCVLLMSRCKVTVPIKLSGTSIFRIIVLAVSETVMCSQARVHGGGGTQGAWAPSPLEIEKPKKGHQSKF